MFVSTFTAVQKDEVLAMDQSAALGNMLHAANTVIDFGTECENNSVLSRVVPHCSKACFLWETLLDFRNCDVPALSDLISWYGNHKAEDAIPKISEALVAKALVSSTNASDRKSPAL